jgi:hypothetical protein
MDGNLLTWDNARMGLRVETRLDGLLIQTFFSSELRTRREWAPGYPLTRTTVRAGLRVVA